MDINEILNDNVIDVNNEIIDLYVNMYNINKYRYYVDKLSGSNSDLKDIVEKKRKVKYDRVVSLIDNNGLLPEFSDIFNSISDEEKIDEYLKKLQDDSNNYFYMMLIDRYFEDIPYNFLVNLNMMLEFIKSIDTKLIDEERLELYYLIVNFDSLKMDKKKDVYNRMNNGTDYVSLFYDDYHKCKDYAYTLYNNNVINPNDMKKSELSNKYGIDIYELNGEDFTAIVHQTDFFRDSKKMRDDLWKDKCDKDTTISFSVIDQNHFDTIFYDTCIMFGFNNLDIDRIMHIYHSDSMSEKCDGSHRVNEIYNLDNLMKKTTSYNELLYLESNELLREVSNDSLMPSYVMCYDDIYPSEVMVAKKYNLPIVLLNTKKYKKWKRSVADFNPNNYIFYEDELDNIKLKRNS